MFDVNVHVESTPGGLLLQILTVTTRTGAPVDSIVVTACDPPLRPGLPYSHSMQFYALARQPLSSNNPLHVARPLRRSPCARPLASPTSRPARACRRPARPASLSALPLPSNSPHLPPPSPPLRCLPPLCRHPLPPSLCAAPCAFGVDPQDRTARAIPRGTAASPAQRPRR